MSMIIGLIDVDGHHFPNLVLMKLSSYHKSLGDTVEWYSSERDCYDIVYMSKVFSDTYSPDIPPPPQILNKLLRAALDTQLN